MAERTAIYNTPEERLQFISDAEALGETMTHDDFLDDGTKRLTFDVLVIPPPTVGELRRAELTERLRTDILTLPEIRELMRIERGL